MSLFDAFRKASKPVGAPAARSAEKPAQGVFVPHYGPNGFVKLAVVGVSYYQKSIDKLKKPNPVYILPDRDLKAAISGGVTMYTFQKLRCELRPEPTNQYDRFAVQVLADGLPVGYVSRDQGENKWVLALIQRGGIERVGIEISGGPNKFVTNTKIVKNDEAPFTGRIFIKPKEGFR